MMRTPGPLQALWCRMGRRGAFLSFLVLLDAVYGYSLLTEPAALLRVDLLLPAWGWGIAWLGIGGIVATGIFALHDRLQFTVSAAFKGIWGLLFVRVWLLDHVPRGWVSVVIWLAFALTVLLIAGWPEPPAVISPDPPEIQL